MAERGNDRPVVVCTGCERTLERCRVCAREECDRPTCYRCLIVDTGQSLEQPHGHGG